MNAELKEVLAELRAAVEKATTLEELKELRDGLFELTQIAAENRIRAEVVLGRFLLERNERLKRAKAAQGNLFEEVAA
jgi:NTP pyrophosphatase (non-canonical NTP hydrolase)